MFKNHSVHIIATYALLILASPLLATSIASAQAINCPTGYICTPVNPNNTAAEVPRVAGGGTVDSSAPCSVSLSSNLTTGSRGVEVIALQSFLISRGHSIASIASGDAPKGYFGTQTMSAVRQFQQASGIPVTGFVGSETRAKILADCGSSTVQQAEQNSSMSVRDSRPLVCGSRGDLDGNKIITREDYDLLGKAVAGLMAVSLDIGDLNGDSSITVSDWVLLGRYVSYLDNTFPACKTAILNTVTVINPMGGETFQPGDTVNIYWQTTGTFSPNENFIVTIYDFPTKSSTPYSTVISHEQRSANWRVPLDFNKLGQYIVNVKTTVNGDFDSDDSNPFTISVPKVSVPSAPVVPEGKPLVCGSLGDLDRNGVINSTDYDLLGQVVAGNKTASLDLADTNGNRVISVTDWVLLGNYIAGTVTSFSGCSGRTSSSGGEQNQSMNAAIWDAISEYLKNHPQ